jgi:hypothetical protein
MRSFAPYITFFTLFMVVILTLQFLKISGEDEQTARVVIDFFTAGNGSKNYIIDPSKVMTIQGFSVPSAKDKMWSGYVEDPNLATVDGTATGPRAMASMAFNKSSPECCPSPYTTDRGCVCLTDEQKNWLGSRGNNKTVRDNLMF